MGRRYRRPKSPDEELPWQEHLEELADRARKSVIVFLVVFLVVSFAPYSLEYSYVPLVTVAAKEITGYVLPRSVSWMGKTYNVTIIYASPFEGFNVLLYASFLVTLLATSPYIAYQAYAFVAPALYEHEKKSVRRGALAASGLFVLGSLLGYFVVAKMGLWILLMLQAAPAPTENFLVSVRMMDLLDFIVKLTLATGAAFEVPLIIYYLIALGVVDADKFKGENSRLVFIAILVLAAVITPDPTGLSMLMLALPYYALYLLGVWAGERALKKRSQQLARARAS